MTLVRRAIGFGSAVSEAYGRAGGSLLAAAIAYRALFSLIPLATFSVTVVGAVFAGNDELRTRFVNDIAERLDLESTGIVRLDDVVTSIPSPWSVAGMISLGIALWGATGVMSAVRKTETAIFDGGVGRHFARGKLADIVLVGGALLLLAAGLALSLLHQVVDSMSEDARAVLDWEPVGVGFALGIAVPLVLTAAVFAGLMRLLPQHPPTWRAVLVGAGAGGLGFQAVQKGLGWYLGGPADFAEVYGSASAIFAFLLSVYLGAMTFVLASVLAAVLDDRKPASPVP